MLQVLKVNTRGVALYQRLGFTIVGEECYTLSDGKIIA